MTSRRRARAHAKKPRSKKRSGRRRRATPRKAVTRTAGGAPLRWNPEKDDVQRSVVQLVLTLVELVRKLMERQAIRRMEQRTLSRAETEAVGAALMEIERTIRDIGRMFDLTPEDLNLDLGALKLL